MQQKKPTHPFRAPSVARTLVRGLAYPILLAKVPSYIIPRIVA